MTAIREFIKIKNHELYMKLPEGFDYDEVEVVVMPKNCETDSSIEGDISKIGYHSDSFEADDEDYSKW